MANTDMKVLVVDDDTTMRRIVKNLLMQIGFTKLCEAEDGAKAFALLQQEDFGLVVSDWDMPNMTGIDLLRKVRADDRLKGIPFIMVTAKDTREHIIEAVQAKVNQYIVKPFTAQALREKIEKVLH